MKPKTELHHRILELSAKLPAITQKQLDWGVDKCLEKNFVRSRKTLFCLECGHSWKDEAELASTIAGTTCPKCEKKLTLRQVYRRDSKDSAYYAIITKKEEFQVVRMFFLRKLMTKKTACYCLADEVMQQWIRTDGEVTILSLNVNGLSLYYDQWIFKSKLEVRPKQSYSAARYNIRPYKVYPNMNIHDIIKRNGFKGSFHNIAPYSLFSSILRDNIAETLLKTNQIKLLDYYINYKNRLGFYWPSIRICIRNNYNIKDASLWVDYMDYLRHFDKDLLNPKYVCPEDLRSAHDRYGRKKREEDKRLALEEKRKKIFQQQAEYVKHKGQFFGLCFSNEDLNIKVLESIEEFIAESEIHHHCLYGNEYFKKKDSLILSAKVNDTPLETVEVSLRLLKVAQSRGLQNKSSEYHDRIIKLVEDNMRLIAQRQHKKKRKKKVEEQLVA